MRPTIYIETSVPSYYCDGRAELVREIARTRQWWDAERAAYECFVSQVVIDELETGDYPTKAACLALVSSLPLLEIVPEVTEIARVYVLRRLMPGPPIRDALHLALACYYRMDYLVTWNCRHLANANKIRHLEVLNQQMGLGVPLLVTPAMLEPWENDNGL